MYVDARWNRAKREKYIKPRRKVDGDIATPSRVVVMARLSTDRKNRQDSSPSFILSPRISLNITRRSTKDFRWRRDEANWNCLESRNQPATFVSLVCSPSSPPLRVWKSANSNLVEEHERISFLRKIPFPLQKFQFAKILLPLLRSEEEEDEENRLCPPRVYTQSLRRRFIHFIYRG